MSRLRIPLLVVVGAAWTWGLFACLFLKPSPRWALAGVALHLAATGALWGWASRRARAVAPLARAAFALGLGVAGWILLNLRPYWTLLPERWPYRRYGDLGALCAAFADHALLAALVAVPLALLCGKDRGGWIPFFGGGWGGPVVAGAARAALTWRRAFWALALLAVGLDLAGQALVNRHADARWLTWLPLLGAKGALNASVEELLYRGALLAAWRRLLPDRWAVLAQALQYGVFHLFFHSFGGPWNFFAVTATLGYLFGWAAIRTGSLAWGVGLHALLDLFPEHEALLL